MKTDEFDYDLPNDLIAYYPLEGRTQSKLLLLDKKTGSVNHNEFFELPLFLRPDDLLVLNDTKVIPARLIGHSKSRSNIEVLLTQRITGKKWQALIKRPKEGLNIRFEEGINGKLEKGDGNYWNINFNSEIDTYLSLIGNMPLPPYIERAVEDLDKERYQTVYAKSEGAIAAPTAGLHFTNELLNQIADKGIQIENITLHVGVGTFRPVKTENIEDHEMHSEYIEISRNTADAINSAKEKGRRIVAVGTTVVRALESMKPDNEFMEPFFGFTNIFITPPYNFRFVDGLITNFHMPRSTLLMLVSAFAGKEFILKAYEVAKNNGYRFLSYGDAMFIY